MKRQKVVAWSDDPPVPGRRWFEVSGSDRDNLINRVDAYIEGADAKPFSHLHPIERVRALVLPFYEETVLLDIQVEHINDQPKTNSSIASLLYGPKGVTILDGSSSPIHVHNAYAFRLSSSTAIDYLRFFCAFVRSEEGPFRVVENDKDLVFQLGASGKKLVKKPKLEENQSDEDIHISSTIQYGDGLFKSLFAVEKSGMVQMVDDDLLTKVSPRIVRVYDGIYRTVVGEKS